MLLFYWQIKTVSIQVCPTKSISRNTTAEIVRINYMPGKYFINQNQLLIDVKKKQGKNSQHSEFYLGYNVATLLWLPAKIIR